MKIRREETWKMYWMGWCPTCGKVITKKNEIPNPSHAPGICWYGCKKCGFGYTVNMLENENDLMEVDNAILPTKKRFEKWNADRMKSVGKE